jgi:hypothetical protein
MAILCGIFLAIGAAILLFELADIMEDVGTKCSYLKILYSVLLENLIDYENFYNGI